MKKSLVVFCIICVSSSAAFAANIGSYDAGALNSQYMKELKFHDISTRAKNKNAILKQDESKQIQEQRIEDSNIKTITFVNNNAFSSDILLKKVSNKLNQPMTPENVVSIRKSIMKYYQEQGYYSAVALIVSQNFKTGELIIEINEGTKNSIIIEE